MSNYQEVKDLSPIIKKSILTGRMPPWFADPLYGKFKNDLSLSPKEKRTLIAWIDSGCPKGKGKDPLTQYNQSLKAIALKDPPAKPDFAFSIPEQVIPPTGVLAYRYFQLSAPLDHDLWVRKAVFFLNPNVVHHVSLLALRKPLKAYSLIASPEMHIEEKGEIILTGWTHGMHEITSDEFRSNNVALFVPRGSYLALEAHYNPSGKWETDQTKIKLFLYQNSSLARKLKVLRIKNRSFKIPPGVKEYKVTAQLILGKPIVVLGLWCHMHYRGARMKILAQYLDGHTTTLLSVPYYEFDWQNEYWLNKPLKLTPGTRIIVKGAYDNSSQNPYNPNPNQWVKYGLQTTDEMFNGHVFYYDDDPQSHS